MKGKYRIATFALLTLLFPWSPNPGDTIQKNPFQTQINWTRYEILVETQEPLAKISSQEPNLDWIRSQAYERALKSTQSRLSSRLESLIFNENYTLGEYIRENPEYLEPYHLYLNSQKEKTTHSFQNKFLILKTKLKILGSGNLLSLFYSEWGGQDLPEAADDLPEEKYTGFLIDARGVDFTPSLFPKVQLEDGRDILNQGIALPNAIQEKGLVLYTHSEADRLTTKRIGNKPLRIPALYVTGKNKTNLVIPYQEAIKILSSPTNRQNWKLCKIAVLTSQQVP